MNQQELRKQQLLQELYNQQQMQGYQNDRNSYLDNAKDAMLRYRKYKSMVTNALNSGNKIASLGQNMSNFGTKLQGYSNPYLNQIGSKIGNLGTSTTNLGNNIQTGINSLKGIGTTASTAPTATTALGAGTTGTATGAGTLGTTAGTLGATGATTGATAAGTGATLGATGAGATAAGAGAGMGAAGGAAGGAAAAGMSAVPVIGWGLLAATALYSMLNSARQKKNAKALKQGMEASAKGEQIANEQTAQAIQNNAQTQQEADNEVNQQLQSTGLNGLTGLQPEKTTTQNGLTQNGRDMMAQIAQQLGVQNNKQDEEQNGNKLLESATSILPPAIKGTPMDMINGQISKYTGLDNNSLSFEDLLQNPFSSNNSGNNNSNNNSNKFNWFDPEAIKAQNEAKRQAYEQWLKDFHGYSGTQPEETMTGGAAPVTQQTTQPVATQKQDPTQLQGGVSQTSPAFGEQVYKTNGNSKIAQLLDQYRQGYKDNTSNTIGNTYFDPNQQKTFANRLGEFVGTGQRIASNPLVQGLIAGGVDYAMGSNPGKAALTGIDWAKNKAASDRYEQLINGNNKRSIIGSYTAQDYNAKLNKDYKDQVQQNWIDEQQRKKEEAERKYNLDREKWEYTKSDKERNYNEKIRHNKEKEATDRIRANNSGRKSTTKATSSKKKEEKKSTTAGGWAF